MTIVLLASDSDSVFAEVDATLASDDCDVLRVRRGTDVLPVIEAKNPDLVILDLQIGSMGGIATCIAIRQEEGAGRLPKRAVALLLDRQADVFLAGEARADGWLIKPIDSLRLRRLTRTVLAGDSLYEGGQQPEHAPADEATGDDAEDAPADGATGESSPEEPVVGAEP